LNVILLVSQLATSARLVKRREEDLQSRGDLNENDNNNHTTVATALGGTPTGERFSQALMGCKKGTAVLQTLVMTTHDYDAATGAIGKLYDSLDKKCNQTLCPQADWAGCILRATGHDFMDFADGTGGSDGCLDMQDKHNGGLHACLFEGEFGMSINDAYQEFCTEISLADFMVLAGEAVMKKARDLVKVNDPALNFKQAFKFGRRTAETCDFANGRLPLVEESCKAVEKTFVDRLQLNWRETAALMGVHTLGRARENNSGFSGWWSDAENNRLFNNNYFKSLINKGWMTEQRQSGNWQWKRTDDGLPQGHHEMMLDTDMCLAYAGTTNLEGSKDIKASVHQHCCAWRLVDENDKIDASNLFCGFDHTSSENIERMWCCGKSAPDCGEIVTPNGRAFSDVAEFAVDEGAWLSTFVRAWHKATEMGQSGLKNLNAASAPVVVARRRRTPVVRRRRTTVARRRRSTPHTVTDTEAFCSAKCKAAGWCCSSPGRGGSTSFSSFQSSNELVSCAQACMMRASGVSQSELSTTVCPKKRCFRQVKGKLYLSCHGCADSNGEAQCDRGEPSEDACKFGATLQAR